MSLLPNHHALYPLLEEAPLADWLTTLPDELERRLAPSSHGDLTQWLDALARLPTLPHGDRDFSADCVRVGRECDAATREALVTQLRRFHPWRKGPFCLHGIHLDTEWRSDWKWNRLAGAIAPLTGQRVLDVGSGNGYYCWRMVGAGARLALGIDPTMRFVMQFHALRKLLGPSPAWVLPFALEEIPAHTRAFDTVFSMGVLYHRRDPSEHLQRLRGCLRPGGELVLETLVVDEANGPVLVPPGRYAKMRNVWAIPTPGQLQAWVAAAGFEDVRLVDVTPTSTAEQRRTEWMTFHSLAEFLDPTDPDRTVEGHPAPVRAIVVATAA